MKSKHSTLIKPEEAAIKRLNWQASLLYGIFYAVGFSILTWGYDALALNSYGDANPWDKMFLGLPIVLVIGAIAGYLGGTSSTSVIPMLIWGIVGVGVGFLIGHMPFEGLSLMTWLKEPRFWGEIIYPFDHGAEVRTILIAIITTLVSFVIGGLNNNVLQWAWDKSTSNYRLSWKSLAVLWVSLPFAVIQAGVADMLMYQPLREPQKAAAEMMDLALDGDIEVTDSQKAGLRSLQPFEESLTPDFTSHLVGFSKSTDSWYSGFLDLELNSELILRCSTVGDRIVFCEDYSTRLRNWVGDLTHAGLTGEQRWLDHPMKPLVVDEKITPWLSSNLNQLSEDLQIKIDTIIRGWYLITVEYLTGYEIQCRFHSVQPITVDECVAVSSTMP